ncbi:MAG: hypothetical protein MJ193_01165, partial [Clostridia bacterium]|nr:hypothetical protein [Clostridia bacterium]
TVVQIVCGKCIKNRRARMLVVVAVMLVVMLVPVFAIDAIFDAKVSALQAEAASGVVIEDYSYQLSYYHTHTGENITPNGKRVSLTDTLIKNVTNFCTFYNIPYFGDAKLYSVNNLTCEPLYFDQYGFDYNEDGSVDELDHIRIMNTFDKSKETLDKDLQMYKFDKITLKSISGANTQEVKGNFACKVWTQAIPAAFGSSETKDVDLFVWYDADKTAQVATDGIYGEAFYSKNGLLSDGYIFSAAVALNIMEDYYAAPATMNENLGALNEAMGKSFASYDEALAYIRNKAVAARKDRYTNSSNAGYTEADNALWNRETSAAAIAGATLTQDELTAVLQVLGGEVGTSKLFKSLLGNSVLSGLIGSLLNLNDIINGIVGEALGNAVCAKLGLNAVSIGLAFNEGLEISLSGGPFTDPAKATLKLDHTFSLDPLVSIVGQLLDINDEQSIEAISGIIALIGLGAAACDPMNAEAAISAADEVSALVTNILFSLYWYQSPVIDTVYSYYEGLVDYSTIEDKATADGAKAFLVAAAEYDQAFYEGSMHGYMIGSQLLGSKIGDGTYDVSLGLADITAVKQMQTDLSYKPMMYSILIVRDMLMTFAAIAIFFTALSYICADREVLYATGKIEPKDKKNSKKGKEEVKEDDILPEEDDSDKEVQ